MVRAVRVLFLENDDSYSWNVVDCLRGCGAEVTIAPGRAASSLELRALDSLLRNADAVVLGPGPHDPVRAGLLATVGKIIDAGKPLLGICLGHQAIGLWFGARVVRTEPVHGATSALRFGRSRFFTPLEETTPVMRYHSLALEGILAPLRCIATAEDGVVMAIEHQTLPIAGLQFHPDSFATPRGTEMVASFLRSA